MNCSNHAPVEPYTSQLTTVFAMNKTCAERFGIKVDYKLLATSFYVLNPKQKQFI